MKTALAAFIQETPSPPPRAHSQARKRAKKRSRDEKEEEDPLVLLERGHHQPSSSFLGGGLFRHNAFLESLLERLPRAFLAQAQPAQSSSAAGVGGGGGGAIPAPVTMMVQAPDRLLADRIERYYGKHNPCFGEAERHIVPSTQHKVEHLGTDCGPGERIIQVARYGRIYKRKSGWFMFRAAQNNAPAGTRYCKMCDAFLPLDAFYSHIRRYVCRVHHSERVQRTYQIRSHRDPSNQGVFEMWEWLSSVRHILGYTHVDFDKEDIRSLMIHCGLPFSMAVRLLPIDPSLPMRPRNVAFVSRESGDLIVQTYAQMCSRGLFMAQVQRCNLMPKHMDAGWPENPTHDPEYRRADVDVGPILAEELARETWDAPDSDTVAYLLAHERDGGAPWVERQNHYKAVAIAFRLRWMRKERRTYFMPKKERRRKAAPEAGATTEAVGVVCPPPE